MILSCIVVRVVHYRQSFVLVVFVLRDLACSMIMMHAVTLCVYKYGELHADAYYAMCHTGDRKKGCAQKMVYSLWQYTLKRGSWALPIPIGHLVEIEMMSYSFDSRNVKAFIYNPAQYSDSTFDCTFHNRFLRVSKYCSVLSQEYLLAKKDYGKSTKFSYE